MVKICVKTTCVAFIALAVCTMSASAGILFETTPDLTEPTGAPFSDSVSGTGQFFGSSFVIGDDSYITGLTWMGVNTGDMNKVNSFTLEIWNNGLLYDFYDVPNERLATWTVSLTDANQVNTGSQIYGLDVYNFAAELDSPFEITGGETYWLVVHGNSSSGSMFAWLQAENRSESKGATYSVQSGEGPQWWSASRESTFTVLGAPVPEPATISILMLAAAIAGNRRFRHNA
ncbi:MAG: PEP-CTERM sorting domain-containing protein [Phycisphaerae bacterium]|jgi:hypothetical protein|nr:PEP-CTERM sorting domain-containing protein [Phycisphaerae bacterium]